MFEKELRPIQIDPSFFPPPCFEPRHDATFDVPEQHLEDIVRSCYILARRTYSQQPDFGEPSCGAKWDGGVDQHGVRHSPIWPKVARQVVELGAPPAEYMACQFQNTSPSRPPLPNAIYGKAAAAKWARYCDNVADVVRASADRELNSIRRYMSRLETGLKWPKDRARRLAVSDFLEVEASAFTRYCVAMEFGLSELAARFHARALAEYTFQKVVFDEVWAGCIPAALQQEAEQFLQHLRR